MMKLRLFSMEKLFELLKDACLKESMYWREPSAFPATDDLVRASERDEMVSYLLEICERSDMALGIEAYSLSVSLLDRFLGSYKVKSKYLECLAVACLYIACKVKEEDEKISVTSEFLIDCGCKCSIAELLRMELMVLTKFEWAVNDTTAADFLYMYHGLLVNSYASAAPNTIGAPKNKWNVVENKPEKTDSVYPPADLDFLHLLEHKLKQCLGASELATVFRPRVLAFALLSVQLDKIVAQDENNNEPAWHHSLGETMRSMQVASKLSDEVVAECKEKLSVHLASLDANKTLFDRYLDEYYFGIARGHRSVSSLFAPLSAISTQLSAIKEEDEEDECTETKVLASIANKPRVVEEKVTMMDGCGADEACANVILTGACFTYADIVLGRHDQKRKLSENSSVDEEFDCDIENRLN